MNQDELIASFGEGEEEEAITETSEADLLGAEGDGDGEQSLPVLVNIDRSKRKPLGLVVIEKVRYKFISLDEVGLAEQAQLIQTGETIRALMKKPTVASVQAARESLNKFTRRVIVSLPGPVFARLNDGEKLEVMDAFTQAAALQRKLKERKLKAMLPQDPEAEETVSTEDVLSATDFTQETANFIRLLTSKK